MTSDCAKAQALLADLDAEIAKIKDDRSRSPNWIASEIERLRAVAIPKIAALIRDFDDRIKIVLASREAWGSKQFLLSRQPFDNDPVANATIKIARMAECAAMDSGTLQLVAKNAIDEKELALLWTTWLAGLQRAGEPGWVGISLAGVELPGQSEALALIAACQGLVSVAHTVFGAANGKIDTGSARLEAARAQALNRDVAAMGTLAA